MTQFDFEESTPEEIQQATIVVSDALGLSLRALSAILSHEGCLPGAEFVLSAPEYDRLARYIDEYRNGR